MTKEEREKIRKRCEAATPGPWSPGLEEGVESPNDMIIWGNEFGLHLKVNDTFFIAHARQDIPALLDALDKAEAAAKELSALYGSPVYAVPVTSADQLIRIWNNNVIFFDSAGNPRSFGWDPSGKKIDIDAVLIYAHGGQNGFSFGFHLVNGKAEWSSNLNRSNMN